MADTAALTYKERLKTKQEARPINETDKIERKKIQAAS